MGAKVRIELNSAGIKQLLCSAEIGAECKAAADRIAAAAGEGFQVTEQRMAGFGGGRVAYGVEAATYEARLAEAENGALSGAVTQCRS